MAEPCPRSCGLAHGLSLLIALGACADEHGGQVLEAPFLNEEDLTLLTPQLYVPLPIAHPLNDSKGWAYLLVYETASQLNAWTLNPLRRLSPLIEAARADKGEPSGGGTQWGPYDDPWERALTWVVWSDGERTELRVREPDTDGAFQAFWSVKFHETGDGVQSRRAATLTFNAALIEELPELGSHVHDTTRNYEGRMIFEFTRDPESGHSVTIAWEDFFAEDEGFGDYSFSPGAPLEYTRSVDGSGSFDMSLISRFDDDIGFTGMALDRVDLEMTWFESSGGFSRMTIAEDGENNPGGDPLYGPLDIQECFDDEGYLLWRDISDAYLVVQSEYEKGELDECEGTLPWSPPD